MNKTSQVKDNKISLITKRGEMQSIPQRGQIWLVEFPKAEESRKPIRPCLVVSNDIQNELDQWIMVAPLTTKNAENIREWEIYLEKTPDLKIDHSSKVLFNYLRTINKERLKKYLGAVSLETMIKAKKAWEIAFDWEF